MTERTCGECGLCCKVLDFPELGKPAGAWCRHYAAFRGCTIYETRPHACRAFKCTWLLNTDEFSDVWRPDRAGFCMWSQNVPAGARLVLEVDADRPRDWLREPYLSTLRAIARRAPDRHVEVIVRTGRAVQMLFPEGLVDLGEHRALQIDSGYRQTETGPVPFAHFVEKESDVDATAV